MDKYLTFNADDFAADLYFQRWVLGQLPKQERFWDDYIWLHPDKKNVIIAAADLVQIAHSYSAPLTEHDLTTAHDRIMAATDRQPAPALPELPAQPTRRWGWMAWAAAACLTLAVGAGSWWFWPQQTDTNSAYRERIRAVDDAVTEYANTGAGIRLVILPDHSRVQLESGSRISIPASFGRGATRPVYLSGEAFFEVTPNAKKPFIVYANQLITKVLGTSFRVRALPGGAPVQVDVKTGRVSVYADELFAHKLSGVSQTMVLMPNQQARFYPGEETLVKELVPEPTPVSNAPITAIQRLHNVPVARVFADLETAYGVKISFDEASLRQCTVTAEFTDESYYDRLSVICEAVGAHYEIDDGQLLIIGGNCSN